MILSFAIRILLYWTIESDKDPIQSLMSITIKHTEALGRNPEYIDMKSA